MPVGTGSNARRSFTVLLLPLIAATAALFTGACKNCQYPSLLPAGLEADPSDTGGSDGDGVFDPGETAAVDPVWVNHAVSKRVPLNTKCPDPLVATASVDALLGPEGAAYTVRDRHASYGPFPDDGAAHCHTPCYSFSVSAPETRPATHWDAFFDENFNGGRWSHRWTLHIGESFEDVPRSNGAYSSIETILHNGIADGCTEGRYCPSAALSRAQDAAFLSRAIAHGDGNVPTGGSVAGQSYDCTAGGVSLYDDIAAGDPYCKYVHYLSSRGFDVACGPSRFCPSSSISRSQFAVLLAGSLGVPIPATDSGSAWRGRSYSCDPASPHTYFKDVSASDPFCREVHYLWSHGILEGCSEDIFCPSGSIHRDETAHAFVPAFGLRLDAPPQTASGSSCPAGLCLLGGRFVATLAALDPQTGQPVDGVPVPQTDRFGYFSLPSLTGDATMPEVIVKAVDATSLPGGTFWIFYSSLTSLAYTLTVTDTVTGTAAAYDGNGFCGGIDTASFPAGDASVVRSAARALTGSAALSDAAEIPLLGGRFRATLTAQGPGDGVEARGLAIPQTDRFGYFSLPDLTGDPSIPEVFVKMLDATSLPDGSFWVFHTGLTNLSYTLTVTDTVTGAVKTYRNDLSDAVHPCGGADTAAFR